MATYERVDYGSPDGSQWGGATSDKLAFYGTTPVSQRASSDQAASLALSASIGTGAAAVITEICATLTALGIWKGSA